MKYKKTCECCRQTITAYTHNLNKPLIQALRQLVDFYDTNRRECNLQGDLRLTKNQYNNFQKLQYFKLVQRTEHGYYPTQKGSDFIYGKVPCFNSVATYGKDVLEYNHEAWVTHKSQPYKVMVSDIDQFAYKKREEYKEEKRDSLF